MPELVGVEQGAASQPAPVMPLAPERWDNVGWCAQDGIVVIAGSDAGAVPLAVSLFLQRRVGVRWWIPGELGEDIPAADIEDITRDARKTFFSPSWYSRNMSGLRGEAGREWLLHNMLRGHVSMNHSLDKLLDRSVALEHPDWFPPFSGKAFDPTKWKWRIPHPVYSNPELVHFVAQRACEYFDANHGLPTFSISPSDSSLFGDLEIYGPLYREGAVFRGKADLSDIVFSFDNSVARELARSHPERYLGALAYSFYENVPSFPVEGNIIPIITADRSQWYDEQFRAEDLALVRSWAAAGPRLIGTWDYYYGSPYLVPRPMLRSVSESIPELHGAGVRVFYCELYPIWGFDAPKAWLACQLLWDVTQEPQALLDEFFKGFFGPAAAQMRRFYEECDRIWLSQPGRATWIRYYADMDQAMLYSDEDIASLGAILDTAASEAVGGKFARRVALVQEAFTYTRRIREAWKAWKRVAEWTPERPAQELYDAIAPYAASRADMATINSQCVGAGLNQLYRAMEYLETDEPLAGRLALLSSTSDVSGAYELLEDSGLALPAVGGSSLFSDPFAGGKGRWFVSHWPEPLLEYDFSDTGNGTSLEIRRANSFSAQRTIRIRGGRTYYLALRANGTVSGSSTVRLQMEFVDKDGNSLSSHSDRLPPGTLDEVLLAVAGTAPQDAVAAKVTIIARGQADGDRVGLCRWQH
jgi:hypothetical protein